MFQAVTEKLLQLEKRLLSYLGIISYGIYMYHMLIDYQLRYLLPKLAFLHLPKMLIIPLYYIILLLVTIAVAALSYHYFEKFFLRLKDRLHNKQEKLSGNYVSTKN